MPRKNNYVTRAECIEISSGLKKDIGIIKDALVGSDLRGGLVKDVNDLKSQLKEIQKSRETSLKWKFAAIGLLGTILGVILRWLLGV